MILRCKLVLMTALVGGCSTPNPKLMSYTSIASPKSDKSGIPCVNKDNKRLNQFTYQWGKHSLYSL